MSSHRSVHLDRAPTRPDTRPSPALAGGSNIFVIVLVRGDGKERCRCRRTGRDARGRRVCRHERLAARAQRNPRRDREMLKTAVARPAEHGAGVTGRRGAAPSGLCRVVLCRPFVRKVMRSSAPVMLTWEEYASLIDQIQLVGLRQADRALDHLERTALREHVRTLDLTRDYLTHPWGQSANKLLDVQLRAMVLLSGSLRFLTAKLHTEWELAMLRLGRFDKLRSLDLTSRFLDLESFPTMPCLEHLKLFSLSGIDWRLLEAVDAAAPNLRTVDFAMPGRIDDEDFIFEVVPFIESGPVEAVGAVRHPQLRILSRIRSFQGSFGSILQLWHEPTFRPRDVYLWAGHSDPLVTPETYTAVLALDLAGVSLKISGLDSTHLLLGWPSGAQSLALHSVEVSGMPALSRAAFERECAALLARKWLSVSDCVIGRSRPWDPRTVRDAVREESHLWERLLGADKVSWEPYARDPEDLPSGGLVAAGETAPWAPSMPVLIVSD